MLPNTIKFVNILTNQKLCKLVTNTALHATCHLEAACTGEWCATAAQSNGIQLAHNPNYNVKENSPQRGEW